MSNSCQAASYVGTGYTNFERGQNECVNIDNPLDC